MYLFLFKLSRMKVRFMGRLMNSKYRGGALLFLKTVMKGFPHPAGHFIATSLETSGFTRDLTSWGSDAAAEADEEYPDAEAISPSSLSLEGLCRFMACLAICFACREREVMAAVRWYTTPCARDSSYRGTRLRAQDERLANAQSAILGAVAVALAMNRLACIIDANPIRVKKNGITKS